MKIECAGEIRQIEYGSGGSRHVFEGTVRIDGKIIDYSDKDDVAKFMQQCIRQCLASIEPQSPARLEFMIEADSK